MLYRDSRAGALGVIGGRRKEVVETHCSRISPAVKFASRFIVPVAQKVQPIEQPTCEAAPDNPIKRLV